MTLRSAIDDPRSHAVLTLFWCLLVPVAIATGWIYSTAFVSALSLVALILGQGSWWAAAKVAQVQDEDANVSDVIEKLDEKL